MFKVTVIDSTGTKFTLDRVHSIMTTSSEQEGGQVYHVHYGDGVNRAVRTVIRPVSVIVDEIECGPESGTATGSMSSSQPSFEEIPKPRPDGSEYTRLRDANVGLGVINATLRKTNERLRERVNMLIDHRHKMYERLRKANEQNAKLTKENGFLQECIKHDDAELRELREASRRIVRENDEFRAQKKSLLSHFLETELGVTFSDENVPVRSDEGKPLNFEELKFLGDIRGMFPGDSIDQIKTTLQYLTEKANEGGRAITNLNRVIDAVRHRREAARSAQAAVINEKHLIDELMQ